MVKCEPWLVNLCWSVVVTCAIALSVLELLSNPFNVKALCNQNE